MFLFGWDELGAHFYTYWGCTCHFSRVFNLKFQYFIRAKLKMPET